MGDGIPRGGFPRRPTRIVFERSDIGKQVLPGAIDLRRAEITSRERLPQQAKRLR